MKHAYMIMVHKNSYTLEKLLELIDNPLNDIFIHVDKKCTDFDFFMYQAIVKKSRIFFLDKRIIVNWGGYSQVKAELELMKYAVNKGNYRYFHLLSGQDLPLKTQKFIHEKCSKSPNKLYLDYKTDINLDTDFGKKLYLRCSVNHYLQEWRNKSSIGWINKSITFLDRFLIAVQFYILKRDFIKEKQIPLVYGSNWFSLPQKVVELIISNEEKIEYYFSNASFCDELFIQTILAGSSQKFDIEDNLRYIDFGRSNLKGHLYIWKDKDFEELISSSNFFSRKFDENIDRKIIDKITEYIKVCEDL